MQLVDLFGVVHCTRGHEERCQCAEQPDCTCLCDGVNHGIIHRQVEENADNSDEEKTQ